MQYNGGKLQTRIQEQNIHNLVYAQFPGVGEYDIPEMLPTHIDNLQDIPLQGFNYALKEKHPEKIGVHFFLHDYQFERVWNYPDRYIEILKRFSFVLSPQFSTYEDMPKVTKIFNIYRNRWCGRYWQEHGIKVIPTFAYGGDEKFEWCFDGLPKHSTIAVSTMGDGRWGGFKTTFDIWDRIQEELEPETILLYGKDLSKKLSGNNIVFKKLISSKVAI